MAHARWFMVLFLAASAVSCARSRSELAGSRHTSIHGSQLITEHRLDRKSGAKVALAHVLFVVNRDVPAGGYGNATGSGGTVERTELHFQYDEERSGFSVSAAPVVILGDTTVQCGSQAYPLSAGNLFIALVHDDGRVDLEQVRQTVRGEDVAADALLDIIKKARPDQARFQALKL